MKHWLIRSETWTLAGLYFAVPLFFSHLPALFGLPFAFDRFGAFEGAKNFLLFSGVLVLLSIKTFGKTIEFEKRDLWCFLLLSAISIAQTLFWGGIVEVLFGIQPFAVGTVSILAYWSLYRILETSSKEQKRTAVAALLSSLFFVSMYSLVQAVGADPIRFNMPFEANRVFSTLGNPNMLAGYAFLLLPFIMRESFKWKIIFAVLAILNIIVSGSLSLLFFALGFIVGHFTKESGVSRTYAWILFLLLCVWIAEALFVSGGIDAKRLSLETRGALFLQGWETLRVHPWTVLFGIDSLGIASYFDTDRLPIVARYVSDASSIQHTHFFPLDLLLHFGLVFLGAFSCWIAELVRKHKNDSLALEGIVLFGLFALLHQPESVHWMILALALA